MISILILTGDSSDTISKTIYSVRNLKGEIIIGLHKGELRNVPNLTNIKVVNQKMSNLGKRKQNLINLSKGDWIFILDTDEIVSKELNEEITLMHDKKNVGYRIPYQNYVFGKPVYWGGEKYSKVRLFRKSYGKVTDVPLHEEVIVNGAVGDLKGKIYHYSYRTPLQLFKKFTKYAWIAAKLKRDEGEKVSFKKLLFYGPHMFKARYIIDKGYKDGWRGFILAFAFMYMESITYWFLFVQVFLA